MVSVEGGADNSDRLKDCVIRFLSGALPFCGNLVNPQICPFSLKLRLRNT